MRNSSLMVAAHPRVGGENAGLRVATVIAPGSSPRGRGKRGGRSVRALRRRLIPAWAGKTRRRGRLRRDVGAHPRVGGENSKASRILGSLDGSSPRGRGKPLHPDSRAMHCGLIPAWAGKTRRSSWLYLSVGAHPRVGGENSRRTPESHRRCRLIPAWAGKTLKHAQSAF